MTFILISVAIILGNQTTLLLYPQNSMFYRKPGEKRCLFRSWSRLNAAWLVAQLDFLNKDLGLVSLKTSLLFCIGSSFSLCCTFVLSAHFFIRGQLSTEFLNLGNVIINHNFPGFVAESELLGYLWVWVLLSCFVKFSLFICSDGRSWSGGKVKWMPMWGRWGGSRLL